FKEGRTPALWQDYQALRAECPENYHQQTWADGPVQEFRWVKRLAYEDSEGRCWRPNALECTETLPDGAVHYFAWLTPLPVSAKTVAEIAQKGGRDRWKLENEGFNRQKNSGLNLEHVYSIDPEKWKTYYLLLQIAFILVQLLERGSLLRRLAEEAGQPVWKLFGSLKNVARRLLDSVRYLLWEESWFDPDVARAAAHRAGQLLDVSIAVASSGLHLSIIEVAQHPLPRRRSPCAPRPAEPGAQLAPPESARPVLQRCLSTQMLAVSPLLCCNGIAFQRGRGTHSLKRIVVVTAVIWLAAVTALH